MKYLHLDEWRQFGNDIRVDAERQAIGGFDSTGLTIGS